MPRATDSCSSASLLTGFEHRQDREKRVRRCAAPASQLRRQQAQSAPSAMSTIRYCSSSSWQKVSVTPAAPQEPRDPDDLVHAAQVHVQLPGDRWRPAKEASSTSPLSFTGTASPCVRQKLPLLRLPRHGNAEETTLHGRGEAL